MCWEQRDVKTQRLDFVMLAGDTGVNLAEQCRRFGISRKCGYKWLARFKVEGESGLADRSRRPHRQPRRTNPQQEQQVLDVRDEHPGNGPRKLRRRLLDQGHASLPAVSTFARILQRHGRIEAPEACKHRACQRFERPRPNQLWQMDFKGHFPWARGGRCHPLTVLDDHSRFLAALRACTDETDSTVRAHLVQLFRCFGLPEQVLFDNGPPWGGSGEEYTALEVWLLRVGVHPIHGRPFHPQTQGKDERFHRSLHDELLRRNDWLDLPQTQARFDQFREDYNHHRPHEALGMLTPASRYQPSLRSFPEPLPNLDYDERELVRTVKSKGEITLANRFFYIGRAFRGLPLALRPTSNDGLHRVCLAAITVGFIDCNHPVDRPKGNYYPMLRHRENL
jgi:transposase InsO family protein